jgi:hypothetical protein
MEKEIREKVLEREVYCRANYTGEKALAKAIEEDGAGDYIVYNLYNEDEEEIKEIFQYFIVSPWLGEKIKENGGIVIVSPDLTFWGRECCGMSYLDTTEFDFLY